ncbi:hypothetical protein V1504DRAFT_436485 [Lipomyces starkeyi]
MTQRPHALVNRFMRHDYKLTDDINSIRQNQGLWLTPQMDFDTLTAIATETETTAENFRRDKAYLDNEGRYYRFSVVRGLEDVGLEESKKKKEIPAATGRYIHSQDIFTKMKACAGNLSGREYFGRYKIPFDLRGVPVTNNFVDRPSDTVKLEIALLPQRRKPQRKIFVLHGLGGIGKTQLAVDFARVIKGDSNIAECASKIPEGQIPEQSRRYISSGEGNIDAVVTEVMNWLTRPDNTDWLLIFDNVDREYGPENPEPLASILSITYLAIMVNGKELLEKLHGLPLALAQAAAHLSETGLDIASSIEFYEQQRKELMESHDRYGKPLLDYERSVMTTWTISFNAIKAKNEVATNLLLLSGFLDNEDL